MLTELEIATLQAKLLAAEARLAAIAEIAETFWSQSVNRDNSTWMDHRDINTVMLATSLAPEGFLKI